MVIEQWSLVLEELIRCLGLLENHANYEQLTIHKTINFFQSPNHTRRKTTESVKKIILSLGGMPINLLPNCSNNLTIEAIEIA